MTASYRRTRPSWLRLVGIQFNLIFRSGRWVELVGGVGAVLIATVLLMGAFSYLILSRSASPIRRAVDAALPLWMLLILVGVGGWPGFVWRGEPPGPQRDHWTLPVSHGLHDAARVAAGVLWVLVVAIIVGLVRLVSLQSSNRDSLLIYCGFVLGLVTTYGIASIASVVTARPTRWYYGLLAAYAVVLGILPNRAGDIIGKPLSAFFAATGIAGASVIPSRHQPIDRRTQVDSARAPTAGSGQADQPVRATVRQHRHASHPSWHHPTVRGAPVITSWHR